MYNRQQWTVSNTIHHSRQPPEEARPHTASRADRLVAHLPLIVLPQGKVASATTSDVEDFVALLASVLVLKLSVEIVECCLREWMDVSCSASTAGEAC